MHASYCHLCSLRLYSIIFPHYLINATVFRGEGGEEEVIEHKICVSTFSSTSVWNISHSKSWARYDWMCNALLVKYPLFLLNFNKTWNISQIISTDFRKIRKYQISWKSVYWESSCSVGAVGWKTDMAKLIVAFGNFANAPNRLFLLIEEHCSLWDSNWIFLCNVDYSSSSKGNFKALLRSKKISSGEINLYCAYRSTSRWCVTTVAYRGGGLGGSNPPRNSEDIGGVLDRMSKKNQHLDFLLYFTVFSYGCNLLNKSFF